MDVFMEEEDFTQEVIDKINSFKTNAVDISEEEKSRISYHDCGHDTGGKCTNKVEVL